MTNRQVLLLIAAFVTLTLGSFIWFIATWDAEAEESVSMRKLITIERAAL